MAYADDVTIVSSGVTMHGAVSLADAALAAVSAWAEQYCPVISEIKCAAMIITPNSKMPLL